MKKQFEIKPNIENRQSYYYWRVMSNTLKFLPLKLRFKTMRALYRSMDDDFKFGTARMAVFHKESLEYLINKKQARKS